VTDRLEEIPEGKASGLVREYYEDIKSTLRVPMVNLIYRHMATFPEYQEAAWRELRPNLRTLCVWQAAARIQEAASLDRVVPISEAALDAVGLDPLDRAKVRETLRVYNGVNPKGLMAITALLSALEGNPVGGHTQPPELLVEPPELGQPPPDPLLPMADLDRVEPGVMSLLREMSRSLARDEGNIVIPSLFRHFVPWPGFLALLAVALQPTLESPSFAVRVKLIEKLAHRAVGRWPFPVAVGPEVFEAAGYAPETPEHLRATWRRFVPLIARMIVLGVAVEAAMP
jgi:hypothetical protein